MEIRKSLKGRRGKKFKVCRVPEKTLDKQSLCRVSNPWHSAKPCFAECCLLPCTRQTSNVGWRPLSVQCICRVYLFCREFLFGALGKNAFCRVLRYRHLTNLFLPSVFILPCVGHKTLDEHEVCWVPDIECTQQTPWHSANIWILVVEGVKSIRIASAYIPNISKRWIFWRE